MPPLCRILRLDAIPATVLAPLVLLVGCGSPCASPYDGSAPGTDGFTRFVEGQLHEIGAPGGSIALLADGGVAWSGGFGAATPSTDAEADTIWMMASIAKLVTAAAVHQLAAEGRLDLDASVNDVLPFDVVHPRSELPITARLLLDHRSGLRDNDAVIWGHYAPGDPTESLEHWLRDVLVVGGAHYDTNANFSDDDPGDSQAYCNTGYALLGHLVEAITGEAFDAWCEAHLFAPLGMTDTAWMLADLPEARIARPYVGGLFGPAAIPHYGYPDYPDGQLRTTVADLAAFVHMLEAGGLSSAGETVLLPAAAERLWVHHEGAMSWRHDGHSYVGHGGSDRGVVTEAWLDPARGRGALVFLNRHLDADRQREAHACLVDGVLEAAQAW